MHYMNNKIKLYFYFIIYYILYTMRKNIKKGGSDSDSDSDSDSEFDIDELVNYFKDTIESNNDIKPINIPNNFYRGYNSLKDQILFDVIHLGDLMFSSKLLHLNNLVNLNNLVKNKLNHNIRISTILKSLENEIEIKVKIKLLNYFNINSREYLRVEDAKEELKRELYRQMNTYILRVDEQRRQQRRQEIIKPLVPIISSTININEQIFDVILHEDVPIKELLDEDTNNIVIDNKIIRRVVNLKRIVDLINKEETVYPCYENTTKTNTYIPKEDGTDPFYKLEKKNGNINYEIRFFNIDKAGLGYRCFIELENLIDLIKNYNSNRRAYTLVKTIYKMPSMVSHEIATNEYANWASSLHCNSGPEDTYILELANLVDKPIENQQAGRKSKNKKSLLKKTSPKRKSKTEKRKSPNKRK